MPVRVNLSRQWLEPVNEENTMRFVFALGLLITLCTAANAATMLRSKSPQRQLRPDQRVTVPKGYAVPGWTDEETREWLYRGSSAAGLG